MPVLEISDLVTRHDPATGNRLPVRRDDVLDALRRSGDRRGARIAAALPHRDGVLDPAGVDLNAALVAEAGRLAAAERLPCRFVHGDAFALPEPATVFISTGVLHHLRGILPRGHRRHPARTGRRVGVPPGPDA